MSILSTLKYIVNHPLNRKHKFDSVIRFAKWQIGSRLTPGDILYNWVNNSKLLIKAGETGLTGNIYTGLHEFADMSFLLHFLRSEDLFVDIGANLGSYTILACSAIGARGIAFEPVPDTYRRLVENAYLNHLNENVECINKGLSNREENIAFTSDSGPENRVLVSGEEYSNIVFVQVTSLDSVLHGQKPLLIKIDVEGYESLVLEGSRKTLSEKTLQAVIIELNRSCDRYGFNDLHIPQLMLDNGFRPYSYNPFNRTLIDLDDKEFDSGNILFIRDRSFAEQRLRTAPKIVIHGKEF